MNLYAGKMFPKIIISSMIGFVLLFASIASADEPTQSLQAGAVAADITPLKFPVSMTGSFQDRKAAKAHDRLHARCIVIDDGKMRAALVVCDSCLISRDIFDAAKEMAFKKTGIRPERMLMSATHTHTAPTAVALAQCHPDPEYVKYLTRQIAKSVEQANARLVPAQIGWAVVKVPSEVGNRRWFVKSEAITTNPFGRTDDRVRMNPPRDAELLIRPAGPVDPDISILSLQTTDKKPLALFANYSLHYVGGIPPGELSADYFGEFARQIAKRLDAGESFVGVMSNGTSGDVNNYNFRQPRPPAAPFERVREVADRIAEATQNAYKTIQHTPQISLEMVERTIDLGVRRPNPEEIERAKSLLAQAKDPKRLNIAELYAQETLRLADAAPTVNMKLQALQIGDLGVVAIPCEVFAEIGLEIKRRSPLKPTLIVGLANGYNGYLPSVEQHALGGYETWRSGWSYLEENASTKITDNVLEMLDEVAATND